MVNETIKVEKPIKGSELNTMHTTGNGLVTDWDGDGTKTKAKKESTWSEVEAKH